ncbi:nuclear transport factor 2 family protein [Oceanicaulis sp.]|uniref:nuclear transport factor 2 family protein n=1 Tax=Oceanicaulis sp. TaxID=1924941 RepID=UPI003D276DAF
MKNTVTATAIALCALIASAPVTQAQERRDIPVYREIGLADNAAARRALTDWFATYRDAWAREDSAALAALHTVDTEWINAYARMFQDADTLELFLQERLFPQFDPHVSITEAANMQLISMRLLGDDAAVIHVYTDGNRGPSRTAGESARRTHMHLVLTRTDEGWKAAHTAIMDARR